MHRLTLVQANSLISAVQADALQRGLKPLSAAVLDPGANLVAFQRQDGAPQLGPKLATGKAAGALALGVTSRRLGEMAVERPHFIAAASGLGEGGMIPAAGGIIVCDTEGTVLGALGVSGDTSDNDEACALAAIAAAGFVAKA
ncbi:MAG: heme-binding protein [Novosphingobium sp.]|nr:heme-binding protein [Novosphingobium sp.]MBO9603996.1 heme-binding protein [Novosphingobium sp.]